MHAHLSPWPLTPGGGLTGVAGVAEGSGWVARQKRGVESSCNSNRTNCRIGDSIAWYIDQSVTVSQLVSQIKRIDLLCKSFSLTDSEAQHPPYVLEARRSYFFCRSHNTCRLTSDWTVEGIQFGSAFWLRGAHVRWYRCVESTYCLDESTCRRQYVVF